MLVHCEDDEHNTRCCIKNERPTFSILYDYLYTRNNNFPFNVALKKDIYITKPDIYITKPYIYISNF